MSGITVCGRHFDDGDIALVRRIIEDDPKACRRKIATRTCEALGWIRPNGRLKEMSCRVALLRLEAKGYIALPSPRKRGGNKKPYQSETTIPVPEFPVFHSPQNLPGLRLRVVESRADSRLWNEAVARFHYLGYNRLPGAQLRYLVEGEPGLLGVLGFGASAWKVAARDRWIGWTDAQRKSRLHLVVNNARFLLLPWIRSKNLASWVLGKCARRLSSDWQQRYGYRPLILETFVDRERFDGTCYKAANWIRLGETQGRGKLDRFHRAEVPVKLVYVYPLEKTFRRLLCA
jgi:hypothetical protein